jgi:hypothetical protein
MQFIKNGPNIPEELLQAHEEGRVVFFCGAGISYPAGLPGFGELVDKIYDKVGMTRNAIEQQAYEKYQFDATLSLLEHRLRGGRVAVRTALAEVLRPNLRLKGATATHNALLQLARSGDDCVRLVTTNFDRIFEGLTRKFKSNTPAYPAPMLPVPKNSRWNGIVYLHGLLPEVFDENALHRLVVTSGDFGLAYLTERWAARFVSELFRNYVVCFVGYSIDDPVLRYMMDALAADRMLGEVTPQAYAFGSFEAVQEEHKHIEWAAKGVKPILYEAHSGPAGHAALHETLKEWAATYRDGVRGRERIVVDYAMTRPMASTQQDDFVGRMLWALSHESGLPAKQLADFDPVPSLDWLESFSDNRYGQNDLIRFGVSPLKDHDEALAFSLIQRPAPYTRAPWMVLTKAGAGHFDEVMRHVARWLIRHLNNPALVLWLVKRGGHLHEDFSRLVEDQLDFLAKLERDKNLTELERISVNAPDAVPHLVMRTLWRLLLTGRVKSNLRDFDLYRWKDRFNRDGLTTTLRLELRELLSPRISIREHFNFHEEKASVEEDPLRLKDLVNWELVLSANYVREVLIEWGQTESGQKVLPQLLGDIQQLLLDALDLMREIGEADDHNDRSHWDLSSISPHWQNRGYRDWVSLIELLRDAWLATLKTNPDRARQIAQAWLTQPYPTFKRLALFASATDDMGPVGSWTDWLLTDDGWWLWSVETQREAIRLLVTRGHTLEMPARTRIEDAILIGPPRSMFRDDIEPERWQQLVDHNVWLRLAKLRASGTDLGDAAGQHLTFLILKYPEWQLAQNESDEFSHWMSGTGDPDFEDQRQIDRAPRHRIALMDWLLLPPSTHHFNEDDWREVCREKFATATCALYALAQKDYWPSARWREALQAWGDEKWLLRSWRYLAPTLLRMPDDELREIAHSATWWLEAISKILDRNEHVFLELCGRFLALDHQDGMPSERPVARAINHPVGHVTQALLNHWFTKHPLDGDRLPDCFLSVFTKLSDTSIGQNRHGRVLLAANAIALFRVDPKWATQHLLPLFNWSQSRVEANAAWEGFLWSPRLYRPLFTAFKRDFLETSAHYAELGEHGQQYAAILTHAALDPADTFTKAELYDATKALPVDGLQAAANSLLHSLEASGDQRENHWTNRIAPYWKSIWPKDQKIEVRGVSERLARLVIAARDEFPAALVTLHAWLQPLEHPDYVVALLYESNLIKKYPRDALEFLDVIIRNQQWAPRKMSNCLDDIKTNWPGAVDDTRWKRLVEYARGHGV